MITAQLSYMMARCSDIEKRCSKEFAVVHGFPPPCCFSSPAIELTKAEKSSPFKIGNFQMFKAQKQLFKKVSLKITYTFLKFKEKK